MMLIYLHNQKLDFLENQYSDKGRRIGTLIEEWPGQWGLHVERAAGGLTALMLLSIVAELTRLNERSVASVGSLEASKPPLGHIAPETPSDVL
jgi:hypothetical protein